MHPIRKVALLQIPDTAPAFYDGEPWENASACNTANAHLFIAPGEPEYKELPAARKRRIQEATAICLEECPVIAQCLDRATIFNETGAGQVAGGKSGSELSDYVRDRRRAARQELAGRAIVAGQQM